MEQIGNKLNSKKMKKIIFTFLILFIVNYNKAQETIATAAGFNSAAEGNLYKATDDGQIYVGLRDKTLKIVGSNSLIDNVTLTGGGTTANPYRIAQQGATDQQVLTWNTATSKWMPATPAAASNWLLTGNSNANASSFLGTINDIKMQLRSNNTPMLEIGRRQTLGLWDNSNTGLFPYNQQNATVSYIRGTAGNSALQFESTASMYYKPVFYTDSNGNFKMKGSAAGVDFFEMGSSGTNNNGRFDFVIGKDGDEPFVFSKYNYSPVATIEMMRMQGTGLNNDVRVGINTNGVMANSTLQNNGSLALAVIKTNGNLTLTENHYSIIINGTHNITLPNANTCVGRIYVIKNPTANNRTISNYTNLSGTTNSNNIPARTSLWIQSDGSAWQQIN